MHSDLIAPEACRLDPVQVGDPEAGEFFGIAFALFPSPNPPSKPARLMLSRLNSLLECPAQPDSGACGWLRARRS